jgi:hypothetical protein
MLFAPIGQPEPKLGINLVRDMVRRLKWLQHISEHSGTWLIRMSLLAANVKDREQYFCVTFVIIYICVNHISVGICYLMHHRRYMRRVRKLEVYHGI